MSRGGAPRKAKVLIVDDHRTFAQAMGLVISMQPDLEARAVIAGSESSRALAADPPDVVLVDAAIAARDGLGPDARSPSDGLELKVLVLSGHGDDPVDGGAIGAGVYGYLSKFEPIDAVLDAIRRAVAGEPLSAGGDGRPARSAHGRRRVPHATERQRSERLSPRERQILQLMVDGMEPPQIAADLEISPATLRTHMQNILTKLGVHSKTQAVLVAMRQGKVSAGP
jgi:DNA-binding NarL/FixJ family response regulator